MARHQLSNNKYNSLIKEIFWGISGGAGSTTPQPPIGAIAFSVSFRAFSVSFRSFSVSFLFFSVCIATVGLEFGLDMDSDLYSCSKPAGLELEYCPVRLGLGLDSRHAGLELYSDSRKRGLVATLV